MLRPFFLNTRHEEVIEFSPIAPTNDLPFLCYGSYKAVLLANRNQLNNHLSWKLTACEQSKYSEDTSDPYFLTAANDFYPRFTTSFSLVSIDRFINYTGLARVYLQMRILSS